eukprot:3849069-Prymnesium_polylepis.1
MLRGEIWHTSFAWTTRSSPFLVCRAVDGDGRQRQGGRSLEHSIRLGRLVSDRGDQARACERASYYAVERRATPGRAELPRCLPGGRDGAVGLAGARGHVRRSVHRPRVVVWLGDSAINRARSSAGCGVQRGFRMVDGSRQRAGGGHDVRRELRTLGRGIRPRRGRLERCHAMARSPLGHAGWGSVRRAEPKGARPVWRRRAPRRDRRWRRRS